VGCVQTPVNCDDGNACTADSCEPAEGCVHTPVGCNDGNACTTDGCDPVQGCTHSALSCDDGSACTADSCEPAQGCLHTSISCNDGNACTTDSCDPVQGCTHSALSCDDGSVCTIDSCDPAQGCLHVPVICDDASACTADSCDAVQGCLYTPITCSDGDACTADSCEAAVGCVQTPITCDDGNACTADACDPATGCQHSTVVCNDGNACTADSCNPTTGCQYSPVDCSDGNECTVDSCSPTTGCVHTNSTGSCTDDGNPCTSDVCGGGVCTHPSNGSCDNAFVESGGRVVMEAEHFSANTARASHTWDLTANTSASGGQLMQANPNNGTSINTGYTTGSPQLDFPVLFTTTGTYYVWVRGYGPGTADRTCHAGIDGSGPSTSDRISGFTTTLSWRKSTLDGPVATIRVATAGKHTINLWLRDDGFRVDKILLTTSSSYTPTGAGPAESPRGGTSCSTDANCNDGNPCTQDTCVSGFCQNPAVAAGTSCTDDGNACTNDVCSGGVCTHPDNGSCGTSPCTGFCANPINFTVSGSYQSGNLGTAATCHQTTNNLFGGNCGNFSGGRALFVNGTQMTCNGGNWPSLPAKVNGGYCVYTTAGDFAWAYFTAW
jgi:hypothetical protein